MIIFRCISNSEKDMQPYTDIITNKDTIDRTTHVFAPSKPEKLKHIAWYLTRLVLRK